MLVGTNIQGLNNGAIESKFNFEVGCCDLWAMKEIQSWYDCKPIIFLIPLSYPPKYQYFIKKKNKNPWIFAIQSKYGGSDTCSIHLTF